MSLRQAAEWAKSLEGQDRIYARRLVRMYIKYGIIPELKIPKGMGREKARVLWYHFRSFIL